MFNIDFLFAISIASVSYQYLNWAVSSLLSVEYEIVYTPPFAESVTEGDIRWEKGTGSFIAVLSIYTALQWEVLSLLICFLSSGVGDFVKEDDLVGEIETDKVPWDILLCLLGYKKAYRVIENVNNHLLHGFKTSDDWTSRLWKTSYKIDGIKCTFDWSRAILCQGTESSDNFLFQKQKDLSPVLKHLFA